MEFVTFTEDRGCLMVGDVAIVPNLYGCREGVEVIHPNNQDSEIATSFEEMVGIITKYSD
ncbi:MAG: hypothetical protein PVG39_24195 [Desulfobacteraceae bacterium]|jgi:hypothetical protein